MYCIIATVVALLYIFWDVNYLIRAAVILSIGRLFEKKIGIKDVTTIYGICTTQDVNVFVHHMNNARYVRELDFGRYHYYDRTGIFTRFRALKARLAQGVTNIRYRRGIHLFTPYKIETKLVYWEDNSLFVEQKFITFDGFVCAIALTRQIVVRSDAETLLKGMPGSDKKPECPEEIRQWLQAIETSKTQFRKSE